MRSRFLAAAVLAGCAAQPALAERPGDRAWLQGGVFRAAVDTKLRADAPGLGLVGTEVDLERDLGLADREWLPKVAGGVRIGRAFRLEADYLALDRKRTETLDRLLGIEETIFPAGAEVTSEFRTDIWRVGAGWSPLRRERVEAGVAIGAHVSKARVSLEADVPVAGETVNLAEEKRKFAPLPNVGVYGLFAINGTFSLQGRVDVLKIRVGDYKGELIDARFGASARLHRRVGVGLAYRLVDYEVEVDKDDWSGRLDYRYSGPQAFAELAF